jgi:hypothetical protein
MKKLFAIMLWMGLVLTIKAQCTVEIEAQSPVYFCHGESVILEANGVGGGPVLDQEQTNYTGGSSELTGPSNFFWQSFTAGITGKLVQIDIGFFGFINGVGILSVYTGNGVGGTLLFYDTVTVYCSNTPNAQILSFPVDAEVTAGLQYTLKFDPDAGMPNPYGVQVEMTGTYNGGSKDGTNMDLVFKTYVEGDLHYSWSNGSTDSLTTVSTGDVYTVTMTDASGCLVSDDIEVFENTIDTSATQNGIVLTANQMGANYQWIDCLSGQPIPSATNQSYTASSNGSFAVVLSYNGCVDTSSCHAITTVSNEDFLQNTSYAIYPNPTNGNVYVPAELLKEHVAAYLFDLSGRFILAPTITGNEIATDKLDAGFYILILKSESSSYWFRLEKL